MREHGQLRRVDPPVELVDEREVHARDELHGRRRVGVRLAAGDLEAVYAVLVHGLPGGRGGVSDERVRARPRRTMAAIGGRAVEIWDSHVLGR